MTAVALHDVYSIDYIFVICTTLRESALSHSLSGDMLLVIVFMYVTVCIKVNCFGLRLPSPCILQYQTMCFSYFITL